MQCRVHAPNFRVGPRLTIRSSQSRPRTIRVAAGEDNTEKKEAAEPGFGLDELDPVRLGRKSRQAFDDLWSQFATLASPTRSFSESGLYQDAAFTMDEKARNTRVLVIGATGRTGRIAVRKLLLRGYAVRMLVRNKQLLDDMVIPASAEVIEGDITDADMCQEAVKGMDKVVFAASSRSNDPESYRSVFVDGLRNVLHAFMDEKWKRSRNKDGHSRPKKTLADFKWDNVIEAWNAQVMGHISRFDGDFEDPLPKVSVINGVKQWTVGQNSFIIKKTNGGNMKFRGAVNDIGSGVEIGASLKYSLDDAEGILLRLRGDGNIYGVVCTLDDGQKYTAQFITKWGYSTVRIPFPLFRPDWGGSHAIDATRIISIGLRFENIGRSVTSYEGANEQPQGRFNLEVDWIKSLPAAKATEFVMVSCAGVPREGIELNTLQEILMAKRIGESMLRNSGMPYTIVRPTTLIDEPGGLKALVFDQGDRVSQSISAVDVADVCVRALPQPLAGNKTFEVAHEGTMDDDGEEEIYELVAHIPDKSTNYLGAALANLQKNT